jgi:2-haloacid dehalogenase/putative hydrolase of the HAD superfamily
MRRWDVVTFDCYGTLIDWETGIAGAFREAARATGTALDVGAALAAYHEIEPVVQAEAFRSYREVLAESARRVAARLGWRLPAERAGFLAESLPSWPPFADTNAALDRLAAAGCRLGILSNVDDDLLAGTRRRLAPVFDPALVVTAQQVRSYKPAPAHFEEARRRIGGAPWVHAAQSLFHDVAPTRALGIPGVWINRQGQRPAGPSGALADFRTLAEFADWLVAVGPDR